MRRPAPVALALLVAVAGTLGTARGDPPEDAAPSVEEIARMLVGGDGDDWNRARARLRFGGESGKAMIRALVRHADPRVRRNAIQSIWDGDLREFEDRLKACLGDPVDDVWWAAYSRLMDLGPETLASLGEFVRSKPLPVGAVGILGPVWVPPRSVLPRCSWSPDGGRIAVASAGIITIWNVAKLAPEGRIEWESGRRSGAVSWSPDGRSIGVADPSNHRGLIWRRSPGGTWAPWKQLGPLDADQLDWWPSADVIVSGFAGRLVAWDAGTGRLASEIEGPHPRSSVRVAVSPSGDRLAAKLDDRVMVWKSLTESAVLFNESGSCELAWSPDGRHLAVSRPTRCDEVWNVTREERVWRAQYEGGFDTRGASWSPDGLRMVTTSDRGILVRNALTGEPLAEIAKGVDSIVRVSWSPDGRWLASIGGLAIVTVWSIPPPPRETHRQTAARLLREPARLDERLDALWEDLAALDLTVSGNAEGVLSALGDPACAWIAKRIGDRLDAPDGGPLRNRELRAVSALAGSTGSGAGEVLVGLEKRARGKPATARLVRWALDVRRQR